MLEKIKGRWKRGDREWDGWMDSPTQWTWIWAHYGSWWWAGRPGVLQSMGSQGVRHDWWLDWAAPWSPFDTVESLLYIFLERICKKKEINEIYMYWHYVSQAHRIGFERYNYIVFLFLRGFPHGDSGEEPTCQYRRCRDAGSIPGSGSTPGGRHDNPLQDSFLEILMDEKPGGLQTIGSQRVGTTERQHRHTHSFSVSWWQ